MPTRRPTGQSFPAPRYAPTPVEARKVHAGAALFSVTPRSFSITRIAFSRAATASSLAWIALSMAAISRTLVEGT
jgi:hypothetical protein